MRLRLLDRSSLGEADWPGDADGDYARRYLEPFLADGPRAYVANADTTMLVLRVGDLALPITRSDEQPGNSYVCSPYAQYVTYALEELRTLRSPRLERLLALLVRPLGAFLRHGGLDRAVLVNNWLLSTNLYLAGERYPVREILGFLAAAFPDHAIVFRSVDSRGSPGLCEALRAAGCRMVFSRSVYYQDAASETVLRRQQWKVDRRHLARTPYRLLSAEEISPSDVPRLRQLYDDLYLRKYSTCNPQFTEAFLRLALERRLLTVKAFARDGRIDAVLGYFARHGLATPPLFGYDTSLPRELGLYRLLSAQMSVEAERAGLVVHFSGGAGHFKRLRGGVNALEYNAVYDAHLPARRRRAWALLQRLMDHVAVPLVRRRGL